MAPFGVGEHNTRNGEVATKKKKPSEEKARSDAVCVPAQRSEAQSRAFVVRGAQTTQSSIKAEHLKYKSSFINQRVCLLYG